jgi:hypothetical protein
MMADTFYTEAVPCPPRDQMNTGLSAARHSTMLDVFGIPCAKSTDCTDVTDTKLKRLIETRNVGPFRVTGLEPALDSLQAIFNEVHTKMPGLYSILGSEGMLCCRTVRGRPNFYSNHSWGAALDIKVGGILPPLNARRIPRGLLLIYPYFHQHGWFWGAGYNGRTDPMHFEIADETIRAWKASGKLG